MRSGSVDSMAFFILIRSLFESQHGHFNFPCVEISDQQLMICNTDYRSYAVHYKYLSIRVLLINLFCIPLTNKGLWDKHVTKQDWLTSISKVETAHTLWPQFKNIWIFFIKMTPIESGFQTKLVKKNSTSARFGPFGGHQFSLKMAPMQWSLF
jgi:hypothetical protein